MDFNTVMQEREALGKERTKKIYLSNAAHEPLFGVATGAMKPLAKKIKINQPLAEQLYATGNYAAMYFASIITEREDWLQTQICKMLVYIKRKCPHELILGTFSFK